MNAPPVPNCSHRYGEKSIWDLCLDIDRRVWEEVARAGGPRSLCECMEVPRYAQPPHLVMPPQGRRFQFIETVPLPDDGSRADVVRFRVPYGWDGVIVGLVNRYLGVGFVEGSGDLSWGLRIGHVYARDYGNVTTSLGDLQSSARLSGPIRILSGQDVAYEVRVAAGASSRLFPSGRVLCAVFGWYYPRP